MTHPLDDFLGAQSHEPLVPATPIDPRMSVIVRTQGRRPESLRAAIESVLGQDHSNMELLVMVHGDTAVVDRVSDGLPERATESPHRIIGVEGGGRSRPLNVALDNASGDYICVLDDDDLALAGWLSAFAAAANQTPGAIIRAVTRSQRWTTDGGEEPIRATGEVDRPFAPTFDLLAHLSRNDTPICALAFPLPAIEAFGIRFDESLPVFEDWEFLMRLAMIVGVTSIPDETSLYRRLDHGNADTAHDESVWQQAHAAVIDRLSSRPVLLPVGDARRVASAHFVAGGGSRHDQDLQRRTAELDAITRSPLRWARSFGARLGHAMKHRIGERRP